jgi:hypothetical protein
MTLRSITQMGDTSRLVFTENFDTFELIPFFAHAASCLQRKNFLRPFFRFASGGAIPGQLVEMGFYTSCPTSTHIIPQIGDARILETIEVISYPSSRHAFISHATL